MIEDVLVKVDTFIFPVDFIVLDMEEDQDVSIILGRLFLATGRTLIDVQKGELTMRVQDEQVTFNVFKALKFPSEADCCFKIDIVDQQAEQTFEISHTKDPLEACLTKEELLDPEEKEIQKYTALLEAISFIDLHGKRKVEELGMGKSQATPSIIVPPTLELKPLPSRIKYAFLGSNSTLPVILSALLKESEQKKICYN